MRQYLTNGAKRRHCTYASILSQRSKT